MSIKILIVIVLCIASSIIYYFKNDDYDILTEPPKEINFMNYAKKFCCATENLDTGLIRTRRQLYNNEWGGWTYWTSCSEHKADKFYQTRQRSCNGNDCEGGKSKQARECLSNKLIKSFDNSYQKIPAQWSLWSNWNECSNSQLGQQRFQIRYRDCEQTETLLNPNCYGPSYEQKLCDKFNSIEKCGWKDWSAWSPCTAICGQNGKQYRARSCMCSNFQQCIGPPIEDQLCTSLPPCDITTRFRDSSLSEKNLGYPCSLCPPNYPLPCFTCINLRSLSNTDKAITCIC